jgi:hypothetical protein
VLDAHHFLRDLLFNAAVDPEIYWHRPIIVTDMRTPLGSVIGRMKVKAEHPEDDVIDNDLILVWGDQKTYHNRSQSFGTTLAWNRDARCRSELDHLERHSRHADH